MLVKTKESSQRTQLALYALGSMVAGALAWFVLTGDAMAPLLAGIAYCYAKVGVTITALAPLTIWAIWLAATKSGTDGNLGFIAVSAQRFGFLGTVIGIVQALAQLGLDMFP